MGNTRINMKDEDGFVLSEDELPDSKRKKFCFVNDVDAELQVVAKVGYGTRSIPNYAYHNLADTIGKAIRGKLKRMTLDGKKDGKRIERFYDLDVYFAQEEVVEKKGLFYPLLVMNFSAKGYCRKKDLRREARVHLENQVLEEEYDFVTGEEVFLGRSVEDIDFSGIDDFVTGGEQSLERAVHECADFESSTTIMRGEHPFGRGHAREEYKEGSSDLG